MPANHVLHRAVYSDLIGNRAIMPYSVSTTNRGFNS